MYNLKITIRRLLKDKVFTLINIFGLVIGISSFLVLFIHVSNEKSFDKWIPGHENIYRVHSVPKKVKISTGLAAWALFIPLHRKFLRLNWRQSLYITLLEP